MNFVAEETMRVTLGTKKIIEGLEAGLYKYQRNETGYIILSPRLGAHLLTALLNLSLTHSLVDSIWRSR